jgi:hypothetical protein
MTRTTKYVGFDVHQATTVTSVREAIHVAFEEGIQAQWLHHLVAPLVERVVVWDQRGSLRGRRGEIGHVLQPDCRYTQRGYESLQRLRSHSMPWYLNNRSRCG